MGVRPIIVSAVALALGAFIYLAVFVQSGGANDAFVGPSLRILESVVATSGLLLMIAGALGFGVSAALFALTNKSARVDTLPIDVVAQEVPIVR